MKKKKSLNHTDTNTIMNNSTDHHHRFHTTKKTKNLYFQEETHTQ